MIRTTFLSLSFCLLAPAALCAQALEALGQVPKSAQGLLVVRDPAGARAKIAALMARLHEDAEPEGDPFLAMLKDFGLEKLPDETRGLVVAFLPPEAGHGDPVPVLITAAGDFKAWCAQLKATSKDKTLYTYQAGDKRYALGLKGRWAFVAPADHSPLLRKALAAQGSVLQELEDLPTWMLEGDAAAVMTPRGFQSMAFFAKEGLRKDRAKAGAAGRSTPMDAQMEGALQKAEREVILVAARAVLDEKGNLGGSLRLRLHPNGEWAGLGRTLPLPTDAGLRHLPAQPYLVALGGSLPKAWIAQLSELTTMSLKPMLAAAGMKPEGIQKFQARHAEAQEVFLGLGTVVPLGGMGREGMPLIRLDVEDANAALERQDRFIREVGPLFKESGLDNPYAFQRRDVEGYPAGILITQMDKLMPQQEGMPAMPPMEMGFLAPDPQTLFLGMGGVPALTAAAASYRASTDRLAQDPHVQATIALLPTRAHFYGYFNVAGQAASSAATRRSTLPEAVQAEVAAPTPASAPPLGFAVLFGVDRWELHLTFPAALQEALGTFQAQEKAAKAKEEAALEAWNKAHPAEEQPEEAPESERP